MIPRLTRHLASIVFAGLGFVQFWAALDVRAEEANARTAPLTEISPELCASPLEARLLRDAADGRWDEHNLFAAALIASGVAAEVELQRSIDEFAGLAAELRHGLARSEVAEEQASFALAFLHRRLLHNGYDLQATEIPSVLASGRYNCVSATVLYNCLATEAGLDVCALRLPNHTCSMLVVGDRRVCVEATCADWFDARNRPRHPFAEYNPEATAAASFHPESEPRETISDVALVAMIYYNRGVEALVRLDFQQAIALNRRALWLDAHNSDARGNLLAAINKQALALTTRRRFSAAMALVDEGLAIDPNHAPLRQNRAFIDRARKADETEPTP